MPLSHRGGMDVSSDDGFDTSVVESDADVDLEADRHGRTSSVILLSSSDSDSESATPLPRGPRSWATFCHLMGQLLNNKFWRSWLCQIGRLGCELLLCLANARLALMVLWGGPCRSSGLGLPCGSCTIAEASMGLARPSAACTLQVFS